jgi:hypothetical protein
MNDAGLLTVLLVAAVLPVVLSLIVILADEKRLARRGLPAAWPPATRTLFVVTLWPLALVLHAARTRGSLRSLREAGRFVAFAAVGFGVAVLVYVADVLVAEGLGALFGVALPE